MSASSGMTKAGWLYRRSSVLHRWKKNWFVLYQDGLLRYYDSNDSHHAEEVYVLRSCCVRILTAAEIKASTTPPDEVRGGASCLMELVMRDGDHLLLCAESADDMRAWQYSLEEARTSPMPNAGPAPMVVGAGAPMVMGGGVGYATTMGYPTMGPVGYQYGRVSYGGFPGQVITPAPQPQVIQTPSGTTTIINQAPQVVMMEEDPRDRYRYGRRYGRGYGNPGRVTLATPRYW